MILICLWILLKYSFKTTCFASQFHRFVHSHLIFILGIWATASGLTFEERKRKKKRQRRSNVDLNIGFRERNHECGRSRAFDGPGGELAHGTKFYEI